MDKHESSWILEFLSRQPVEDHTIKSILFSLPNPSLSPHLKKTLLLRQLLSHLAYSSISDKTLDALELIHDLDRSNSKAAPSMLPLPDYLKEAYCDVAVECTLKPLRESTADNDELFYDVADRIWLGRIADLEKSDAAAGLVSERLKSLGDAIGRAVVCADLRERILRWDTERVAWESLEQYVVDALKLMGPTLLELAARAKIRGGKLGGSGIKKAVACGDGRRSAGESGGRVARGPAAGEGNAVETGCPPPERPERETAVPVQENKHDTSSAARQDGLSCEENTSVPAQVQGSGASGMDASKDCRDVSPSKYNILPSPEFNKVKEALKVSSVDLQTAVEDPLPDAKAVASEVLSSINRKANLTQPDHNQKQADANVPRPSTDNGDLIDNLCLKDRLKTTQHSLMDRNPTAHTYEWGEDSIEVSSEGSPSSRKARLASPSKRAISPLKVREAPKNHPRKRKRKMWSTIEEDALIEGVKRHGKGSWKLILSSYPDIFEERTEVDLKDKWRNMTKK